MRPRALVLALTAASVIVPFAGPAHAVQCAAVAVPAHYNPLTFVIEAQGEFACSEAATGMSVTVCIQEQLGGVLGSWYDDACQTVTNTTGATQQIGAKVTTSMPVYSTFFRTTVIGTNANGDTAGGKSAPTPWFNCACYLW